MFNSVNVILGYNQHGVDGLAVINDSHGYAGVITALIDYDHSIAAKYFRAVANLVTNIGRLDIDGSRLGRTQRYDAWKTCADVCESLNDIRTDDDEDAIIDNAITAIENAMYAVIRHKTGFSKDATDPVLFASIVKEVWVTFYKPFTIVAA